jgi:hypothetical protein
MILLTCLFITLFCVVIWLPLEVEVDTERAVYRAGWKGIFVVRGIRGAEGWKWYYRLFFFKKEWLVPEWPTTKTPDRKQPPKHRKSRRPAQIWELLRNSLRAVQVKRLILNWDTNDFITNAYLYPLSHFLGNRKHQFHINFSGKQELSMLLQARPYRLVWAFLRTMVHHK